jgi:DNA repair exonuclease SbcCD ATPase subunit
MITFEKVRWKNILSTGNSFTEIILNKSTNTLIIGHNGAGKSTILDALCFGLFGKPFRKINKPNILNSINQQHGMVEIEFSIGKKNYKIVRGIKPNVFEIYQDGKMLNQDAASRDYQEVLEKTILKLNYKSFTQVVILGSASFVPFMQLSASDRRAIIEDLLDIQIFSSMNSLVKDKLSENKDSSTKNKYDMNLTAEKIKMQNEAIEESKKHNQGEIIKKMQEIDDSLEQINTINKDITLVNKHILSLQSKITDKLSMEKKNGKLSTLESKLQARLKKLDKEVTFYEENDNCPTCKQGISESFRLGAIGGINQTKGEIGTAIKDIEVQVQETTTRLQEIKKISDHIQAHVNETIKHGSTIDAITKYINKTKLELNELNNRKDNLGDENEKLKTLKIELKTLMEKQEELSVEKQYYDYASTLLKDGGIKARIIKQYLPIMNKLINKYLKAMDFFVNFNIDENFNETIKSRHRDEFSYANFSEGEKMRIDLALLFTWRQIAKLKNSTNTNLLILDEVFDSSLDTVGTEEFLKLIHEMGTDTNVFVISHKGDQLFDKFRSTIKFEKHNNFSRIAK